MLYKTRVYAKSAYKWQYVFKLEALTSKLQNLEVQEQFLGVSDSWTSLYSSAEMSLFIFCVLTYLP